MRATSLACLTRHGCACNSLACRRRSTAGLAPLGAAAGAAAGGKSSSSVSEASRAAAGSGDGAGEGGGGNAAAAVQRLLLDIYSSINEPDGIYAVARSHSLLSQVGGWRKAVWLRLGWQQSSAARATVLVAAL